MDKVFATPAKNRQDCHFDIYHVGRLSISCHSLHIATETEGFEGDVDAFICEINPSGVLVMPNSGDATNFITEGLKS